MNKIICDVCGTSYPETDTQCPICGCVRPGEVHTIDNDVTDLPGNAESGSYTYVKGGRFSKSNVRKKMRASQSAAAGIDHNEDTSEKTSKKDRGLLIAVIALLLAVVAVVIYIAVRFFMPANEGKKDPVEQTFTVQTTVEESTTLPTSLEIPCEELIVATQYIELEGEGTTWQLDVQILPKDTTDTLLFESSDLSVVTVSEDGLVTAVSDGIAEIRIVCGGAEAICEITCVTQEETTSPTEETETTTVPEEAFELNRKDFSLFFVGDSWNVYSGDLDPKTITWSSANEKVVTVTDGVVKAVGPGHTTIYGEYNGTKIKCAVHCKFKADAVQLEPDGSTSSGKPDCSISHSDVTLILDGTESEKSFVIMLKDANDLPVTTVTWRCDDDEPCCTINGSIIRADSRGKATVYTTYNGHTYSCIVRVK